MLIAYVSDENYAAIADAIVEIERPGKEPVVARSTASGAVYADVEPGKHKVNIARQGFGSKRVTATFYVDKPYQFRLLSDRLLGYAWPKDVRTGEKSEFRVHSVAGYRISLWRYGAEKEFVKAISWIDEHSPRATMQILPDKDFSQTGVDWNKCGYPATVSNHQIVAPDKSGLYYFHAETASGEFFSFPLVVAPAAPKESIAVLASTNTWNAYNNFGGRSNYVNTTTLPDTPTVNSRQDLNRYNGTTKSVWIFDNSDYAPLSFERPEPYNSIRKDTGLYDNIEGRQAGHLAEAEWRFLGWMEREGFGYDFYSDKQLHDGTLDLTAYKILIISTHPEYWSREQYFKVKDWAVNHGGKLLYLGGNGIDCEVEFREDNSLKFLTHYPHSTPGIPFVKPDGSLLECRFQHTTGESPAALLGVVFTDPGIGTGAPYKVTDATHWVYAGTGLKDGDIFGTASLHERSPGGASGHETDKRSPSTPPQTQFMGKGLNIDDGGAELAVTPYDGGGEVFASGSITWTSSILVDKAVSQITRNVIERYLK